MWYVISYDIEDDRKRTRLAKTLLDYGDRVQYSVFELNLDARELSDVLREALKHVDTKDSLRVYPMCQACRSRLEHHGRPAPPTDPGWVV